MPTSPIVQLLLVLVVSGILFSLWQGGRAERWGATIVAANLGIGILANFVPADYEETLRFALDGLTALALLVITLRFGAPWMGGVMLLYAAQFALHSYYMVSGRSGSDYLHAVINNVNFCAITFCLIVGAAVAWRRRVRAARRLTAATPSPAPPQ